MTCNIGNYLIKRQSEWHIIKENIDGRSTVFQVGPAEEFFLVILELIWGHEATLDHHHLHCQINESLIT